MPAVLKRAALLVAALVLLIPLLGLSGCAAIGPQAVRSDTVHYSSAIAQTRDEQLLANLVRLRYGGSPVFMEVSSLTTQYNLGLGARIQPLWTRPADTVREISRSASGIALSQSDSIPNDEFSHSASIDYHERPTVSYTPLSGQRYVTQIMKPIPLDALLLLSTSGWSMERILVVCTQGINDVLNAPTASGPTPRTKPVYEDFAEVADAFRQLQRQDLLRPSIRAGESGLRSLVIGIDPAGRGDPAFARLRRLLGLPEDVAALRLYTDALQHGPTDLSLRTRSLIGVLYFLANAVQVPEPHLEKGWVVRTYREDGVTPFDWNELMGEWLQIRSSRTYPTSAAVRIRHEGYWFYIDKEDTASKFTLSFLNTLFGLQAGDTELVKPLLTVPVG
jgi:hypothetical protein